MKNLFLFTGEETYLLNEEISRWKKGFIEKHGDINLISLDAVETPIHEIMAAVNAIPFLGDKRLIFIHGLPEKSKTRNKDKVSKADEKRDEQLKKLGEDLKEISETSIVVFVQSQPDKRKSFYKKLSSLAEVKEFATLAGQQLNAWIQKRAQTIGASIDYSTADYLVAQAGQNLWRLSQEIDKLTAYASGQSITRLMVDKLVVPTLEANIFQLTDALGIKDHKKAIHYLHRSLAAGESLRQVFYMIVRQFRLLLQGGGYKSLNPNSNATAFAAVLKLHPFVARNTLAQLKNFRMQELKIAYEKLLNIDFKLKTSGIRVTADDQDELILAIEEFILNFCR